MTNQIKRLGTGVLMGLVSLAMLLLATPANASQQVAYFQQGDAAHSELLPAAFGPFQSDSSKKVGVYNGRLNLKAENLKDKLYLVIRMQEDSQHRFGWVRAYVNNQLVATEATQKESRIVAELTGIKAGEAQISVMGAANAGTGMSFYVVSKEMVLPVLQSKFLGETVTTAGPYQAAGNQVEQFADTFALTKEEAAARTRLSIKTAASKFRWIRVSVNGRLVASENYFVNGEATVEITGFLTAGMNNIQVQGAAASGAQLGWFVTQVPDIKHQIASL